MVAGLGIKPSSGGYEPPGFPVSLPAEPDVGVEPPCLLTKEMTSRKSAPGKHRAELGSASSCMESKSLTSRPTVRESDQRGSNSFFLPGKQACNRKHLGRARARDGTRIRVVFPGKEVPSLSATPANWRRQDGLSASIIRGDPLARQTLRRNRHQCSRSRSTTIRRNWHPRF